MRQGCRQPQHARVAFRSYSAGSLGPAHEPESDPGEGRKIGGAEA